LSLFSVKWKYPAYEQVMLFKRRPDAINRFASHLATSHSWRGLVYLAVSICLTGTLQQSASALEAKATQRLRAQALQHVANGDIQSALSSYDSAIKAAINEFGQESTYVGELYFEEGNLARKNGAAELAKKCYEKAVNYRPADVSARVQLAELERSTGNTVGAFENARIAYAINPNLAISRKELSLCLQLSGRPAEASQIAATLARTSKNVPALPKASAFKAKSVVPKTGGAADNKPAGSGENANGPVITSAAAGANSALHWSHKISADEAKKAKELAAAMEAKRKAEEAAKAEEQKKKIEEQKKKDDDEKKAKQKQKKDDTKKSNKDKSPKDKTKEKQSKVALQPVGEPEQTTSLKTTATTIPKPGEKARSDKSEKTDDKAQRADKGDKPASKSHLNIGAVTEKVDKPQADKHESGLSENEPAKPKNQPAEKTAPTAAPTVAPMVPMPIPVTSGKSGKPRLGKVGLVPPPPPTPVVIPGGMMPPLVPPPTAPPAAPAKPRLKPRPAASEKSDKAEKSEKSEDSSAAKPHDEDPDFLINWGGADKKKKSK
jgi:hypothetical protein